MSYAGCLEYSAS